MYSYSRVPHINVKVYPGGVRVKKPFLVFSSLPARGGVRGEIAGMSYSSHKRLRDFLCSLDFRGSLAYFVTLTFPAFLSHSFNVRDRDGKAGSSYRGESKLLSALRDRCMRTFGRDAHGALWKKEFHRSGTVHFHLLMVFNFEGAPGLSTLRNWLRLAWLEIVRGGYDSWSRGTHVIPAYNTSGPDRARLQRYFRKMLLQGEAPVDRETGEIVGTGRMWGRWGKLPTAVLASQEISEEEYGELCARVNQMGGAGYLSKISPRWRGFLVEGDGDALALLLLPGAADGLLGPVLAPCLASAGSVAVPDKGSPGLPAPQSPKCLPRWPFHRCGRSPPQRT